MGKQPKRQKYRLDPKKFEGSKEKTKKEKDLGGEDLFNEMARSKPRRR